MRICLIAPLALLLAGIGATAAVAADTRRDCQSWASASGSTKAAIANRIGSEHLLTKAHKLSEAKPGASESLYRSGDIQRLCRRY